MEYIISCFYSRCSIYHIIHFYSEGRCISLRVFNGRIISYVIINYTIATYDTFLILVTILIIYQEGLIIQILEYILSENMCLFMPINYIMQNIYHSQMQIYYHLVHYVSFVIRIISSGGLRFNICIISRFRLCCHNKFT